MIRSMRGWATGAITGLALAGVLGGIMIAGGPGQGRAERRDDVRRSDLQALENQLQCLARERGSLDPGIVSTEACPFPNPPADPLTGEPYLIRRIDAENLRLCASFEVAPNPGMLLHGGPQPYQDDGCRVMHLAK